MKVKHKEKCLNIKNKHNRTNIKMNLNFSKFKIY